MILSIVRLTPRIKFWVLKPKLFIGITPKFSSMIYLDIFDKKN